jgi:hypothetical protein
MDCDEMDARIRELARELEHDEQSAHRHVAAILFSITGAHGLGCIDELSRAVLPVVERMAATDPTRN